MSRAGPAVLVLIAVATLVVGACGADGGTPDGSLTVTRAGSASIAVAAPTGAAELVEPSAAIGLASANPEPSEVLRAPDGCVFVKPAEIVVVVEMAVDGLQDTNSNDGWSSACARVQPIAEGGAPFNVSVNVGWQGTVLAFKSMPDARPIADLGDEAYVFDNGQQIAIRSGELVAVVAGPRDGDGNAMSESALEALARLMAERIRNP